jgi:hypothetical protein
MPPKQAKNDTLPSTNGLATESTNGTTPETTVVSVTTPANSVNGTPDVTVSVTAPTPEVAATPVTTPSVTVPEIKKPTTNGADSGLGAALLSAATRQPAPSAQRVDKALNLLTDTSNLPPIVDPEDIESRYIPRGTPSDYRARHYIASRWKPQVDYYDSKGGFNKRRHLRIQAFIGVGSAMVAVVLAVLPALNLSGLSWTAAILSGLISGATVFENVYTYGDNWRKFRQASEGLKREKVLFDLGAGPYRSAKDPLLLFADRCEEIIAEETGRFFQREEQQAQQGQPADQEAASSGG